MKKILLASTILVGSAGLAAADISFSGDAGVGVSSPDGGATWGVYASVGLDVAMSGETDGGLAFGADFTVAGASAWGNNASSSGTFTIGAMSGYDVWISGDFGKVTVSGDLVGGSLDLGYEHTISDFSVGFNYGILTGAWDIELGYDFGDYDVYVAHDSAGVTGIGGSATFGDFSLGLDVGDVALASSTWEISAGYSSGAISVDATVGAGSAWSLQGAYDLGGGASVEAAFDSAGAYSLGVAMEF